MRQKADSVNKQIVSTERINAMEAQISAQTRTLNQYRENDENSEQSAQNAASTAESYENLMTVSNQFYSNSYSDDTMAETLLNVNKDALGEGGQAMYDELSQSIFPSACESLYSGEPHPWMWPITILQSTLLSKVVRMNEDMTTVEHF